MGMAKKLTMALAGASVVLMLPGCEQVQKVAADAVGLPSDKNILFWTDEQRNKAFRMMDSLVDSRTIKAGGEARALETAEPLQAELEVDGAMLSIDDYMEQQRMAGMVVLHDGKIRFEKYRIEFGQDDRWTSFSVAKSLVSTLVGAALQDGYIKSMDDELTDYIPELKGSGYDGVTVQQLLTMTSGVRWNEDYDDPESDVAQFNNTQPVDGMNPIIVYMKTLESEAEPGTRWQYNTGETNLIGVLVAKATGKTISDYLSEKIWAPYGMGQDGEWLLNEGGAEIGGCCISARVRDYALFGQFVLDGGKIGDTQVVPEGWFEQAGTKQADIGIEGRGYGYQWWTYDDGSFGAQGIFGQGIFIDPARKLVIASNSNWPSATPEEQNVQRRAFYSAVQASIDAEAGEGAAAETDAS